MKSELDQVRGHKSGVGGQVLGVKVRDEGCTPHLNQIRRQGAGVGGQDVGVMISGVESVRDGFGFRMRG